MSKIIYNMVCAAIIVYLVVIIWTMPKPLVENKCNFSIINDHKILVSDKRTGELEFKIWKSTDDLWVVESNYGNRAMFVDKVNAWRSAENWCTYTKN